MQNETITANSAIRQNLLRGEGGFDNYRIPRYYRVLETPIVAHCGLDAPHVLLRCLCLHNRREAARKISKCERGLTMLKLLYPKERIREGVVLWKYSVKFRNRLAKC